MYTNSHLCVQAKHRSSQVFPVAALQNTRNSRKRSIEAAVFKCYLSFELQRAEHKGFLFLYASAIASMCTSQAWSSQVFTELLRPGKQINCICVQSLFESQSQRAEHKRVPLFVGHRDHYSLYNSEYGLLKYLRNSYARAEHKRVLFL